MTTVAFSTKQLTVANTPVTLDDFPFSDGDLQRMEQAIIYTKADILITYDGTNSPAASPEFGIVLASGTIFTLKGHENLDNLEMVRLGAVSSLVTVCLEYGE
jgi:hypothetical protein